MQIGTYMISDINSLLESNPFVVLRTTDDRIL